MTPAEEQDLRRRLDGAISRALVDPDYQAELLARPRAKLGTKGTQKVASRYTTLHELAQHLLRLVLAGTMARYHALSLSIGRVLTLIGGVVARRQVLRNAAQHAEAFGSVLGMCGRISQDPLQDRHRGCQPPSLVC
jgi:hypothetical protein